MASEAVKKWDITMAPINSIVQQIHLGNRGWEPFAVYDKMIFFKKSMEIKYGQ